MATQNGVIYYKLDPRNHYDGDVTKNCGLSGGEIDGNFNFLRGYDIADFEVSKDKTELTIIRHNGEKLPVNIYNPNLYQFEYDKVNGVLKVTMVKGDDGKPVVVSEVEGFLSEKNFHVYGNPTITGDGTRYRPIQVSSIAKTGTYQPVLDILDTIEGKTIPVKGNAKGDRYVTKEKVSSFGLLYPLDGIEAIQKRLEEIGSEWRVPTKADWDQLLNMAEDCPQDKTHDDKRNPANEYLGVNAGKYLKSNELWEPIYRRIREDEDFVEGERYDYVNGQYIPNEKGAYVKELYSDDRFGFGIYPLGFGERRGISTIGGFGKWAAFWTSSEEDTKKDMFVKVFSNDECAVEQNTWGRDCYLSLRLVKNYNGTNLYDTEVIDGNTVPTIYIDVKDGDREKYDTTLIWTKENVGFNNKEFGGVVSKEWEPRLENYSDIRYYVNDWDGTKWVKHELLEGESVVVIEHDGIRMHEWRLVDGEFVDTAEMVKGEFGEELAKLDAVIKEVSGRIDALGDRMDVVETRIADAEENIKNNESEVKVLDEKIELEKSERIAADTVLDGRLVANEEGLLKETEARIDGDIALDKRIDTELETIRNTIDSEVENLVVRIDSEEKTRYEADADLQRQISENKVTPADDTLVIIPGATDENGAVEGTKVSVKLPLGGMIKFDEEGLYFDGDYSFGGYIITE